MSVFKYADWWSTNCGLNETFNCQSLCVANIDNSEDGAEKIIVGSYEGFLRIYNPRTDYEETENTENSQKYSAADLLLETQLPLPIIAVAAGKLSSLNKEHNFLAVLHPERLEVVKIQNFGKSEDYVQHYTISSVYRHDIPSHSYNVLLGPFGGTIDREYIAVQTIDGLFLVFEQDKFGFSLRLPNFLMPSPVCYIKTSDIFVFQDSAWNLKSYRYQSLASASLETSAASVSGKNLKITTEWSFPLGQIILDIVCIEKENFSILYVLREKDVFAFKDSGLLLWTKKQECHPVCCFAYTSPADPESNVSLVCTSTNSLLVFQNETLTWNTKLPFVPVTIKKAKFQSISGLLVILSDTGELNIIYLGTQPHVHRYSSNMKRFSHSAALTEIKKLQEKLDKPSGTQAAIPVRVRLNFYSGITEDFVDNEEAYGINGNLELTFDSEEIKTAQVAILIEKSMATKPSTFEVDILNGKASHPIFFYRKSDYPFVISTETVVQGYYQYQGKSFSFSETFELPLNFAMKLGQPEREAQFKLTLSCNLPNVTFVNLFEDMEPDPLSTNCLALQHNDGTVVTMLASKTTDKYRLQSNSLAALLLPVNQLRKRLTSQSAGLGNFRLTLASPLPIPETWPYVENRWKYYKLCKKCQEDVGKKLEQYVTIERTLLKKIQNKNTVNLENFHLLLKSAAELMDKSIGKMENARKILQSAASQLEGSINLLLELVSLTPSAKPETLEDLTNALLPVNNDLNKEMSWELLTDLKLSYIIKKWSSLEQDNDSVPVIGDPGKLDLNKLKKKFFQAFDMAVKGLSSPANKS